jgi:hypothetical protein
MGRYRHKIYEKSTIPRWIAVFGLQLQVIESHRLVPASDLRGAMTADGWRNEAEPRFGLPSFDVIASAVS